MATRWARVLRGTFAAVFATLAAATSHSLAGGTVSVVGLALAVAFATLVCVTLTGRRMSGVRLAASVVLSQLGFHVMFSALGSATVTVVETGHHSLLMMSDATIPAHAHPSWMWLSHALAAALTIATLRHGESAFWRLGQLLFVRTVLAIVTMLPDARQPRIAATVWSPLPAVLARSSLKYRGPPVALVA